MIKFIYGNPGTGKTEYILSCLSKDALSGRKALLIVPEQITVAVENQVISRLPASAQLIIEVVNFSRLANKVFRTCGGLSYNFASSAFSKLLMLRALKIASPFLREYKRNGTDDISLADSMLATYRELAASGISPETLEKAAEDSNDSFIRDKIHDISAICAIYAELLGEKYTDTNNELVRCSDMLKKHKLFADTNIYIDGFSSFTGIEHNIIKSLMQQSPSITIALALDHPSHKSIDTVSAKRCSDNLRRDCALLGAKHEDIFLKGNKRQITAELTLLSESLWDISANTSDLPESNIGKSVELYRASDTYDECEIAAACIRELVESGFRFKDIAVIARDIDKYRGIIEPALEGMELSYFISEKTDVSLCPLSRLILSALNVANFGWKRSDVIAHLKTGLSGIPTRDADIFESYTATWELSGSRLSSAEPWAMNPDGYTTTWTERGHEVLTIANAVKDLLIGRLKKLVSSLKSAQTYGDLCIAIADYLETLSIRETMTDISSHYLAEGKLKEAGEYARMYNAVIDALDCVCDAMPGDEIPDLNEFSVAVKTVLSETSLGSIPSSTDVIMLGSADMLRTDSIKCTVILGACDGEFPANAHPSGLLSDSDREYLLAHDLSLPGDRELRASEELLYFRRAVSSPSERLLVFTRSDNEPSIGFNRIKKLLPYLKIKDTSAILMSRLRSLRTASEYLPLLRGTAEGDALQLLLETNVLNETFTVPVSAKEDMISAQAVSASVGNYLNLSQSKIESFVNCKFAYSCKYLLRLSDNPRAEFAYNNIGTFIHHILEKFLYRIFIINKGCYPDKKEQAEIIDEIIEEYIRDIIPDSESGSARLSHLLSRLKITSKILIDDILSEFADSDFKPAAFEQRIGGADIPSATFALKNGSLISVSGIIDRIDVYRTDDKAYIRVIDYKTGSKTFSISDIAEGLNLQLLIYMYSIINNVKFQNGVTPAFGGISYISFPGAKVRSLRYKQENHTYSAVINEIKRSGLISDSEEVMYATSHSGNNRYLMNSPRKHSAISDEGIEAIFDQVKAVLTDIGEEMIKGNANALPRKGSDACKYCRYSQICRASEKKGK